MTGDRLNSPSSIVEEILAFYKSLMGSAASTLPAVNMVTMRDHQQQVELCTEVTHAEIYVALCDIGDDKAPGVDGYNAYFYKKDWNIIKDYVYAATTSFFVAGNLLKAVNCTSITLIPKVHKPSTVKEYRPLVCCSILYKLIAKVLDKRIQKVIDSIISEARPGFPPGRKIVDSLQLRQMAISKTEGLGLPARFIQWVFGCVTTVSYSIVINAEPTKPFDAAKGLRQGDPISPYLFVIAMEYLSQSLNELKRDRTFKYHPRCAKLGTTHHCFADDLLLFVKGEYFSVAKMHKKFVKFTKASGLQANLSKSSVYVRGMSADETQKSYWAQLFILPAKVMNAINTYCRSFIWSGVNTITKKALVSWERMCLPKAASGMQLYNLKIWNKAAITKILCPTAHTWPENFQTMLQIAKRKVQQAHLIKLLYAEFVAGVWQERNASIFEGKATQEEKVAKVIACVCNVRATEDLQQRLQKCYFSHGGV
ncbi:hypothetical protein FXO37_00562 [Capsicum annuum]|nr:hypothetical protein FXO37_00562 [Capsicum annuum]